MEFGLSLAPDPSLPVSQGLEEMVETTQYSSTYGFRYTLGVGHHWISHPNAILEPWPMLGYLAGKLQDMQVVPFVVAPLYSAVDIAEKVVAMDYLTKGKFIFACGVGWRPEEFRAAGTDIKYRASRFEEMIDLCKRLWTGDEVTFSGRHFEVEGARMALTPLQKPHPPIWVGAQSEAAIRRAARIADAPCIPPQVGDRDLQFLMDAYRDELAKVGKPLPKVLPLIRFLSVDDDRNKALDRARMVPHFLAPYTQSPYFTKVELKYSFEEEVRERTVAGTPAEVMDRLSGYADQYGFNVFLFVTFWPGWEYALTGGVVAGMDRESVRKHTAYLGERVVAPLQSYAYRGQSAGR